VIKDKTNREEGTTVISYHSQNKLFCCTDEELLFLSHSWCYCPISAPRQVSTTTSFLVIVAHTCITSHLERC